MTSLSINKGKKRANELSGLEWTKLSISLWSDINKSQEERKLKHPAMFPQMLIQRLIKCFTTEEDMYILDPFAGSGSALVAAHNSGKCGIGFEINDNYIKLAKSRITQMGIFSNTSQKIYQKDASHLTELLEPESIHFCVTSPPYWDIMSQKRTADYKRIRDYGDHPENIAKIKNYDSFLDKLAKIFSGAPKR